MSPVHRRPDSRLWPSAPCKQPLLSSSAGPRHRQSGTTNYPASYPATPLAAGGSHLPAPLGCSCPGARPHGGERSFAGCSLAGGAGQQAWPLVLTSYARRTPSLRAPGVGTPRSSGAAATAPGSPTPSPRRHAPPNRTNKSEAGQLAG